MSLQNRYDFALLFDITNGNPNGDPDADGKPRSDPQTGQGLITDVCLKRKIRNYVAVLKNLIEPYDLYVREGAVLNDAHERVYRELGLDPTGKRKIASKDVDKASKAMCARYYDVRTFGGMMATSINCGRLRGFVQITFSQSIDPIEIQGHSITRCAITKGDDAKEKETEFARKYTTPYGLYRCHGFITPSLAQKTGFSEEDLALFWQALINMFEGDRAAARGEMIVRGLYVFKHDSALGNAPSHKLFERLVVEKKSDVIYSRAFTDYDVRLNLHTLPSGINVLQLDDNAQLVPTPFKEG
jgi:CRISPR-associated protein Csd2